MPDIKYIYFFLLIGSAGCTGNGGDSVPQPAQLPPVGDYFIDQGITYDSLLAECNPASCTQFKSASANNGIISTQPGHKRMFVSYADTLSFGSHAFTYFSPTPGFASPVALFFYVEEKVYVVVDGQLTLTQIQNGHRLTYSGRFKDVQNTADSIRIVTGQFTCFN